MASDPVRPVAIKVDEDIKDRLQVLAAALDRTPHWLMREAIRQYVEREEKKQAHRRAAMESWAEYRETGLHVTGDEVQAWLDGWGTDDETPAPECHA